jgi:hypothetical protein
MNVEIGTEAAQFPEKEFINGIFLAVQCSGSANISFLSGSRDCTQIRIAGGSYLDIFLDLRKKYVVN